MPSRVGLLLIVLYAGRALASPAIEDSRPAAGGIGARPITLAQLSHRVPDKARVEFDRGVKAKSQQQIDKAIKHLRNAISIYPELSPANCNLGLLLLD